MRVWVTRDEAADGPLSTALRAADLEPVLEPVLHRRTMTDVTDVISQLGRDDWLVLTSVYAVENVAKSVARRPRVAVVGEASRQAAQARGWEVALVSPDGTAKGLFEALRRIASRGRVVYPRSSQADPPKPWPDVELVCPLLYETVARTFDAAVIHRVDVVSVASPSTVDAIRAAGLTLAERPVASIGPTTSAALRRFGVEPWVEARKRTFPALACAIAEARKK